MNKILIIFSLIIFTSSVFSASGNSVKIRVKTIQTYGMHCTGCEETIETEVKKLDGIKSVKADHINKTVTVKYDDKKVSLEQVKQAIINAGYRLSE